MSNYHKSDPTKIQAMFNSIALPYDRNNAILSFGLHHRWNAALVKCVSSGSRSLLDLCCGTGEIAFTYLKRADSPKRIYMLDFSEDMLQCAKSKASQWKQISQHSISYLHADAQAIPLPNESVDAVTIGYGIRNVKDPALCIQEVYRVLQPGGSFGIVELTRPSNRILRFGHHIYLRTLLPVLGWFLSSNQEAYRYLCDSIHTFMEPNELEQLMAKSGFDQIKQIPLSGGIATILFAKKSF